MRRRITTMKSAAVHAYDFPVEHDGPGRKVDPYLFANDAADLIRMSLLVLEGAPDA